MSLHFWRHYLSTIIPHLGGRLEPRLATRRPVSATAYSVPHTPPAPLSMAGAAIPVSSSIAHPSNSLNIEPSFAVEEETVRGCRPEHYYPVQIGHVFHDRYLVVGKLEFGSASTVWLCRDLLNGKQYVALKVYINCSRMHRELPIYTHINNINSQHGGRLNLRKLLDSFEINGPDGNHLCLVHEALGMNLKQLRDLVPGQEFARDLH